MPEPAQRRAGRILLAVLASVWFFPVSCTTALMVGTPILAQRDARDAARGDTVHSSIAVMVIPSAAPGAPVEFMLLRGASAYKSKHADASFLMREDAGRVDFEGHTRVAYKVVERTAAAQTIETEYSDGDRDAWGRYRATRDGVTPLASRLREVGYMYGAMPYALGIALALWVAARLLRRRLSASRQPAP